MTCEKAPLDLKQARDRLAARGKDYWRSLEELAGSAGFEELLHNEFPRQAGGWFDGVDRRQFLRLMGASLALAGLSGCYTKPTEHIYPYVRQPEGLTPGEALYFATAMPLCGYGSGVLVESHEGRPTKVEGNPLHPASPRPADAPEHAPHGPSSTFAQASILTLYDPDRSQAVATLGNISSWDAFVTALNRRLRGRRDTGIDPELRVRILTETVTSPSLAQQLQAALRRFPRARWHVWEPAGRDNARVGAHFAFGQAVEVQYRFDRAKVILALDADFLCCGPGHLRHARDFSATRRIRQGQPRAMSRLYAVESMPSSTGALADHRKPLQAVQVESFARAVAQGLGISIPGGFVSGPDHGLPAAWVQALVSDLRAEANRGASLVIAGEGQPPLVHALAHAINDHLGNVGRTLVYTAPVEARPSAPEAAPPGDGAASLRELVQEMDAGNVDILILLGGNPVYTAPADLRFADRLDRVPFRVHLALYEDETSELCHWHIPEAHYLESWGDVRGPDGTVSVIQPLIAPLYGGKSPWEVLALLTGQPERGGYEIVRAYWRRFGSIVGPLQGASPTPRAFGGDFEGWWRRALHDGIIPGTAAPERNVTLQTTWSRAPGVGQVPGGNLEIVFRPDPTVLDGRFANNGWLQELPKPLSKLTWDNAAYLSPRTAIRLGFAAAGRPEQANGKVVALDYRGGTVEAPLWVLPGHADDSVTVHLGYGRTRAGRVGTGAGFNAYRLRTADAPWFGSGLALRNLERSVTLAATQHHHLMHGRDIVREGTLGTPPQVPAAARNPRQTISLYPPRDYSTGNQWGMSINLTLCNGCSACVVACQAENNIPVVGKDQVARGREMHWIRIDSYYKGSAEDPSRTFFQPVPCMQCENAPCEVVCPVAATAHSTDGLNDMAYNRCVGTRYCSNNCPYKVRRFNFLQFADWETESFRAMRNPNVTVRSRGVMEKCTYCVQRIRAVQSTAAREDRAVRDGEVQTACQAACPAGAIVFGDLNASPTSHVRALQSEPLNYGLLDELNTRPRTTYLAALKNPNPEIERLEGGQGR